MFESQNSWLPHPPKKILVLLSVSHDFDSQGTWVEESSKAYKAHTHDLGDFFLRGNTKPSKSFGASVQLRACTFKEYQQCSLGGIQAHRNTGEGTPQFHMALLFIINRRPDEWGLAVDSRENLSCLSVFWHVCVCVHTNVHMVICTFDALPLVREWNVAIHDQKGFFN